MNTTNVLSLQSLMFNNLQVLKTINNSGRISSIDIFRSIAILSVVIYHYKEWLPYGYLGVSLFFVISGFLIGNILLKEFIEHGTIQYFKFILSRGFKIWPSYYAFLILGNILAYLLYAKIAPENVIPLNDMPRYLFFYKNFIGNQYHWCFEHVWSLCVEEHFYLALPISFIFIGCIKWNRLSQKRILLVSLSIMIILSILFRTILLLYFSSSINTYESTFVRIHELLFGVLLSWLFMFYKDHCGKIKKIILLFFLGLIIFIISILLNSYCQSKYYTTYLFPILIPVSFCFMLIGTYYINFSNLKWLRVIAYYSYNWYLWHTLFVIFIIKNIHNSYIGFIIYLLSTFTMAVLTTTLIEERFLTKRKVFINKYFNTQKQH